MSDSEIKARAKKIKERLNRISDLDLVLFADSIYFSEFKLADEFIKDIANKYDPSIPF